MGLFGSLANLSRIAESLEKLVILKELEVRTRLPNTLFSLASKSEVDGPDVSGVSYLDDEKELSKENAVDAYTERTGRTLRPGQDIPRHIPDGDRAEGDSPY